jgi:membrane protease YdiL (CAAX protease family)
MSTSSGQRPKDFLVWFFVLTFAITWGIGALAIFLPEETATLFGPLKDTSPIYYVAIAAPTISATIFTLVSQGWSGLKRLFARLVRCRFGVQWYALILLGIPLSLWLASRITGTQPLKQASTADEFALLLLYLLMTGPLCEELGWRGFALPCLLERFNPFWASIALGTIWGIWHLPSFFVSGTVQAALSIPIFLIFTPCSAILITWVFQRTRGSVLSAVLFHYMINFSGTILGAPLQALAMVMLLGSILVVALDKDIDWFKKGQTWAPDSQHPPMAPASPTM